MSSTVEAEKSSDQGNSRTKREIHSSEDKDLEDDISPSKRKNLGKRRLEEESEEEDIAPVRKRESKKKTPQHIEESEEEDIAPVRKRESKKKTPQHIEESEEEPSVPKRKRVEKKTLRKESTSKPTEKKHRTSEIVHDSDEESNTSDSGSPPTKLKHKSTPKIVQEEEEDEANELKSPAPKKTEAKRTSAKENASRASPNEEKIKRLKHYINKCGVRKQWGKELADCKTAKSQTNKLEAILKELGVTV
ncbi:hypothetical protein BDF14DRAFT_1856976 [Spinellus fusiger]|nr:hypothetical protein BDF14DRAFT_1856976 [Spinellus fusiger]